MKSQIVFKLIVFKLIVLIFVMILITMGGVYKCFICEKEHGEQHYYNAGLVLKDWCFICIHCKNNRNFCRKCGEILQDDECNQCEINLSS